MKNVKLPILGLSLVLLVASCKKNDYQEESATNDVVATTAGDDADSIGWTSSNEWNKEDQGDFSVNYVTLADSSITADVADNGLVLLFKKKENTINALPFEEATKKAPAVEGETATANYWYHQVSEGSLLISCDVYDKATASDVANSFKYFVITPEKLQELNGSGYTADKLMNLNYAEAKALLQATN